MYKTCKHGTINRETAGSAPCTWCDDTSSLYNLTSHTLCCNLFPSHPPPPSAKHHKWTFLYSSNIYTRVLQICSTVQIIAVFLIYRCWFFFLLTVRKEKLKHERWALLSSPHSCHRNACAAPHPPLRSKCYWCIAPNRAPGLRSAPQEATSPPSPLCCLRCCWVLAFLIHDFPCWSQVQEVTYQQ